MATYKNVSGTRIEIPLYDLHVDVDETFEVPDEEAASFDAQPSFKRSAVKSPDYVAGPVLTGPIPTIDPATGLPVAPAAPAVAPTV